MEGRVLTMNKGAEDIFGYRKEEIIGKKRVSIFSPGEIVIQNVGNWLATADKVGEFVGKTYFLKKDGSKINAKIRITPLFGNGKDKPQTGYCGETQVINEEVDVPINISTKIIKGIAITRVPFTSASILPMCAIAAYYAGMGYRIWVSGTSKYRYTTNILSLSRYSTNPKETRVNLTNKNRPLCKEMKPLEERSMRRLENMLFKGETIRGDNECSLVYAVKRKICNSPFHSISGESTGD